MGLPLKHRLRHWQDFQTVYRQGKRYQSEHLILRILALVGDRSEIPSRFGIVISQKVSKKAVIRNRFKRQIKGAIASLLGQISPCWMMIIIVKPGTSQCEYEHFLRELKELLDKAEVINGH